ncbi:unnamed protein product [Adineta ricciae]|uniref:Uncharacterized protein n=1 Tax=Adineta ricciae TaxID=249248 RepID=A0A814Z525_ADIRI|nr:unnamed protein product [Adineta ricciae]CAF1562287.1 unnamed protein product [Adineta ricciae]
MSNNLVFFVPYHTNYAHVELILSFASFADVYIFVYKWNPAQRLLQNYFSKFKNIFVYEFAVDTILREALHQQEKQHEIIILLTASINYSFGQLQYDFFRMIQNHIPWIIDVYSTGHCMYGCQSCAHQNSHRLPITFTNYIRTKHSTVNQRHEILICPSFSSEQAPFSLLSNSEIIQLILSFPFEYAIKLHPLTYPSNDNSDNPLFNLSDLERKHANELFNSKNIISVQQTNTLSLIEQCRVLICDFDSSIPFEALYFNDGKYLFVYETAEQQLKQDDRRKYFHTFSSAHQLTNLFESYFKGELLCKIKDSHKFFLEKYEEPDGKEIERLARIRNWKRPKNPDNLDAKVDMEKIKQEIQNQFSSTILINLLVLGEHTVKEIRQIYYDDLHNAFGSLFENVDQL